MFRLKAGEFLGEMGMAERRAEKVLTAAYLATDLAPGKHFDGGNIGLFLRVEPNGKRFWVQRLTVKGKRTEIGLGSFPLIKLADARSRATENKRLAVMGGDPLEAKRKAKDALTFAKAMDLFLAKKSAEFGNEKHAKQWRSTLDAYAVPVLGNLPIAAVETRHVLKVLEPIWTEKTVTASRLRQRIEAVLSWATVAGHRTGDNPARWKGNLAELLAKPGKVADKGNHPALALADLPRWWKALAQREGMAARALQFLTMTLARSGEVRGMTWGEVDLKAALWTVPAERMKMGREHRVPLTKEAVALLEALPRMDGCDVVFFAPRGGMLSDMTVSAVMRRMQEADVAAGQPGYLDPRSRRPAVPHGLRSTFRGWAAEVGIERDMAEMALAHNVGSAVERAYQRSDMLERRRAMLATWAKTIEGHSPAPVVSFRRA
jgi:integrase